MAGENEVSKALDGGKPVKRKTHTHSMKIERGASGGHVVHTEKHFGKGPHSEGHSHTEGPHVVADNKSLHDMIDEHMGDQPEAGDMETAQAEPNPEDQAAGAQAAPPAAAGM